MWTVLSVITWPADGYYWIRKKATVEKWIVKVERDIMLFPGTSLRNMRKLDHDIWQWELDTASIVQAETPPPMLPYLFI